MTSPTRRSVLIGAASLPTLGALPVLADDEKPVEDLFTGDFAIGAEDAAVTVYEYVSFTCGYCGRFHQTVWPEIKETYVDSGKVRFVIRGFYRNTVDLDIDMLCRWGGTEAYYPMADVYLNEQSLWSRAADVNFAVRQIAKRAGMSQAMIDECLGHFEFKKALVEAFRGSMADHGVESTPTFVVGDEIHRGLISVEDLSGMLDEALSA